MYLLIINIRCQTLTASLHDNEFMIYDCESLHDKVMTQLKVTQLYLDLFSTGQSQKLCPSCPTFLGKNED